MKMQRTQGDPIPKLYADMAERCAGHCSALMAAVRVGHVLAMLSSARALLGQVSALAEALEARVECAGKGVAHD